MFCCKRLLCALLWGNILAWWIIIFCLTVWISHVGSVLWVQLEWTERCCGKLCFEVKYTVKRLRHHVDLLCVVCFLEGNINLCCWNYITTHLTPTH